MKEWLKAIIILPFNVIVTIPVLILYFSGYRFIIPDSLLQIPAGLILLFFGLVLAVWTMILFHTTGKGTLSPRAHTKKLVTKGPYKYVRNPMIIGVLSVLTAEALILNTILIFYWAVIFFIINCIYFKLFEEKQLAKNFGDEYIEYKKNVPMWIPKLK